MPEGRFCYWIDPCQDPDKFGGYVPSAVFENEPHFYPMEGDPSKFQAPWIWGKTFEKAVEVCTAKNTKMELTEQDVIDIRKASLLLAFKMMPKK